MTLQQSFLIDPLLASMLDGLQEAVWLLDAQTLRVVHANAASMQLTGYTPEQAQEFVQSALELEPDALVHWCCGC